MPNIPTEEDMMSEALENNRRNGLVAKTPTKFTSWLSDRHWVDDQKIVLAQTTLLCHVEEWEEANDRVLHILHEKGEQWSDLYNELACDAVGEARENARNSRYL